MHLLILLAKLVLIVAVGFGIAIPAAQGATPVPTPPESLTLTIDAPAAPPPADAGGTVQFIGTATALIRYPGKAAAAAGLAHKIVYLKHGETSGFHGARPP